MEIKFPIYDIIALSSGFCIGYLEGKGKNVSKGLSYLLKFGPTAIVLASSPIMTYIGDRTRKFMINKFTEGLRTGDIGIKKDGKEIRLSDLVQEEREKQEIEINKTIDSLENQKTKYLVPTALAGARTLVETLAAYFIGAIVSRIV